MSFSGIGTVGGQVLTWDGVKQVWAGSVQSISVSARGQAGPNNTISVGAEPATGAVIIDLPNFEINAANEYVAISNTPRSATDGGYVSVGWDSGIESGGTFVGYQAGQGASASGGNTAIGFQTLLTIGSGGGNTVVGSGAASGAVGIGGCVVIGDMSLSAATGAFGGNVVIGSGHCNSQVSGGSNTIIGQGNVPSAVDASANILLGNGILSGATTSVNANVVIGDNALTNADGSAQNVVLGEGAANGPAAGLFGCVIIGSQAMTGTGVPGGPVIVIGNGAVPSLNTGTAPLIAIGNNALPNYQGNSGGGDIFIGNRICPDLISDGTSGNLFIADDTGTGFKSGFANICLGRNTFSSTLPATNSNTVIGFDNVVTEDINCVGSNMRFQDTSENSTVMGNSGGDPFDLDGSAAFGAFVGDSGSLGLSSNFSVHIGNSHDTLPGLGASTANPNTCSSLGHIIKLRQGTQNAISIGTGIQNDGINNTMVGNSIGNVGPNSSGNFIIGQGIESYDTAQTSSRNVHLGFDSAGSFVAGSDNTFIGPEAGEGAAIQGDRNALLGWRASVPTPVTSDFISVRNILTGNIINTGLPNQRVRAAVQGIDPLSPPDDLSLQGAKFGVINALDTEAFIEFNNSADATNGARVKMFSGSRDPNSGIPVAGERGDLYTSSLGILWQCTTGSTPGPVVWTEVGGSSPPPTSQPAAVYTWAINNLTGFTNMTGNIATGRAYATAAISQENGVVNSIQFYCSANPLGGTYAVGIYDRFGIRLAYQSGVSANLGLNITQLTNDTGTPVSVTISAGTGYYLVVESNINSFQLASRPSVNPAVSASLPPLTFYILNPRTLDPTGLPADISPFFGTFSLPDARNYFLLALNT